MIAGAVLVGVLVAVLATVSEYVAATDGKRSPKVETGKSIEFMSTRSTADITDVRIKQVRP